MKSAIRHYVMLSALRHCIQSHTAIFLNFMFYFSALIFALLITSLHSGTSRQNHNVRLGFRRASRCVWTATVGSTGTKGFAP